MHELFVLDEIAPVPPGKSPFQLRGVVYGRAVEHATKIAGSLASFSPHLKDERIREFIAQRFEWNGLYDALPIAPLQIALARIQGKDFETATRARAAEGALQLIPRMFRLILGFTRPRNWAHHAPRLMADYCGYADMQLVQATDRRAVFSVVGVPQFVAASHANTVIGIFEGSLSVLRASDVRIQYFDVERSGERQGFPTLSYKLELGWT
jgi:hypothetical protein